MTPATSFSKIQPITRVSTRLPPSVRRAACRPFIVLSFAPPLFPFAADEPLGLTLLPPPLTGFLVPFILFFSSHFIPFCLTVSLLVGHTALTHKSPDGGGFLFSVTTARHPLLAARAFRPHQQLTPTLVGFLFWT